MAKVNFLFTIYFFLTSQCLGLSLDEAVRLTLKNNFEIQSAELDRINQRFAVKVSQDQFNWQNGITGESTLLDASESNVVSSSTSITPESSIQSAYGTKLSFEPHLHWDDGFQPEIVLEQHLIRGTNPNVNLAELRNAIDQNKIDQLNYKHTISQAISDTLIAYVDILTTKRKVSAIKRTMTVNRNNLDATKIKFKFGETSQTELVNNRIALSESLSSLSNAEAEFESNTNTLLDLLDIKRTDITVTDSLASIRNRFKIPTEMEVLRALLENNIDYQSLKITANKNQRTLLKVKDDLKPDLTLTGTTNPTDPSDSRLSIHLDVPIHDINREQSVVNAKVDIQKNEADIKRKEIELTNHARNLVQELIYLDKSIQAQEKQVKMRVDLLQKNQLRFNNGFISTFEFTEQINEKEEAVDELNNSITTFASKLINLYNEMGLTLEQWHVNLPKDF